MAVFYDGQKYHNYLLLKILKFKVLLKLCLLFLYPYFFYLGIT